MPNNEFDSIDLDSLDAVSGGIAVGALGARLPQQQGAFDPNQFDPQAGMYGAPAPAGQFGMPAYGAQPAFGAQGGFAPELYMVAAPQGGFALPPGIQAPQYGAAPGGFQQGFQPGFQQGFGQPAYGANGGFMPFAPQGGQGFAPQPVFQQAPAAQQPQANPLGALGALPGVFNALQGGNPLAAIGPIGNLLGQATGNPQIGQIAGQVGGLIKGLGGLTGGGGANPAGGLGALGGLLGGGGGGGLGGLLGGLF